MLHRIFKPTSWFRRGARLDHAAAGAAESARAKRPTPGDRVVEAKTYSRRMMPPFTGQLQVAEHGDARALSIDGKHWELQIRFSADTFDSRPGLPAADRQPNKYTAVASITPAGLQRQALHPLFDTEAVSLAVDALCALVENSSLPYPAADRFEYWLLDQSAQKPLALLHSCISADEIGTPSVRPSWMAMPAAQLPIEEIAQVQTGYVAPVNARLEQLIAERAGHNPRAAWFDRAETGDADFPPCLIDEDWEQEEQQRLCQQYIRRLAPRLLMLQGLAHGDRERLEQAARDNALDVERFHPLYPEVVDHNLLQALRVEARLRRDS